MIDAMNRYLGTLSDRFGDGWNRFWFTPSDPLPLCVLRLATGLMALYYILSHSADLVRWFGPYGLLPIETIEQLTGRTTGGPGLYRFSYLNYIDVPEALWTVHVLGGTIVLLYTVGLFSRITNILSLIVVLAYVHRAPMITGQFEPVLTMLLFYLCFARTGDYFAIDRFWKGRRASPANKPIVVPPIRSTMATIVRRLIQVHLVMLYLMMGLTKLAGETWWVGEAVWWLIAHSESRLVDLTFLHSAPYLLNLWTHAIVLFELSFGLLIWNRLARPLLLLIAIGMWILLALVTGLVSFALIMLVANLIFLSPEQLRALLPVPGLEPEPAAA